MAYDIPIVGRIRKVGNSHAFFIPKSIVDSTGIEEGDCLQGFAMLITREEHELRQKCARYTYHGQGSFKNEVQEGILKEIHFNTLPGCFWIDDGPKTESLGVYGLANLSLSKVFFKELNEHPQLDSKEIWGEVSLSISEPGGKTDILLENFRLRESTLVKAHNGGTVVEFMATVRRWGNKKYSDCADQA